LIVLIAFALARISSAFFSIASVNPVTVVPWLLIQSASSLIESNPSALFSIASTKTLFTLAISSAFAFSAANALVVSSEIAFVFAAISSLTFVSSYVAAVLASLIKVTISLSPLLPRIASTSVFL
jgi:hypothetical protein